MIYILHGEDTISSYNRLQQILNYYHSNLKIRVDDKSQKEEILSTILTPDLLESKKIIIGENLISSKKIKPTDLKSIPAEQDVIFWEKVQLTAVYLTKVLKFAKVEQFKPKPQLYTFLDSLSQNYLLSLKELSALRSYKPISLSWHLAARVQLLILIKLSMSKEQSEKITGKSLKDWQWQKLQSQANLINLTSLKKILSSVVKIDYLIKSGKTNIDETYLISTLLVKYLRG